LILGVSCGGKDPMYVNLANGKNVSGPISLQNALECLSAFVKKPDLQYAWILKKIKEASDQYNINEQSK
jgi:hypothetical protein